MEVHTHTHDSNKRRAPPRNKIKLLSFNHLMKRSNFHENDESTSYIYGNVN